MKVSNLIVLLGPALGFVIAYWHNYAKRQRLARNYRKLKEMFEGREAIYWGKGIAHVRVSKIQVYLKGKFVTAEVQVLPTPGMPLLSLLGALKRAREAGTHPAAWTIDAGELSSFSKHHWCSGYGGWTLFFEPEIIQGTKQMGAEVARDENPFDRDTLIAGMFSQYRKIGTYITYNACTKLTSIDTRGILE